MAEFISANVVIAGGSYSVAGKDDFVASLAKELEALGIAFIPPSGAKAMLSGDFSALEVRGWFIELRNAHAFVPELQHVRRGYLASVPIDLLHATQS